MRRCMAPLREQACRAGRRGRLDWRLMPLRVPDAVQRETLRRRAGTHRPQMWTPDQQRITPQARRAALHPGSGLGTVYSRVIRSRNALPTTLTEDSAIAAAAMIGDSSNPKAG